MSTLVVLLLLAVFLVLYPWFGYLVVLQILALLLRGRSRQATCINAEYLPSITMLISAHDEEAVIEEKVRNALASDYPSEKLQVVVVSDGSTDGTDVIVEGLASLGVQLWRQHSRRGKTAALNDAVPRSRGDIVVFSDANALYDHSALRLLVRHFSDPVVGFVTGRTKYFSRVGNAVVESVGAYSVLERYTKLLESRVGSCVGADGAMFAIRRDLFSALQPSDINDLVIPLSIVKAGYRGLLEERACCAEETAQDMDAEFGRQVRITCRTLRAVSRYRALLNPFAFPLFAFKLLSHKVLRLMLPFFMAIGFVANAALLGDGVVYDVLFVCQAAFYLLAVVGYWQRSGKRKNWLTNVIYVFCAVSWSYMVGWFEYFSGETYTTWSSDRP